MWDFGPWVGLWELCVFGLKRVCCIVFYYIFFSFFFRLAWFGGVVGCGIFVVGVRGFCCRAGWVGLCVFVGVGWMGRCEGMVFVVKMVLLFTN